MEAEEKKLSKEQQRKNQEKLRIIIAIIIFLALFLLSILLILGSELYKYYMERKSYKEVGDNFTTVEEVTPEVTIVEEDDGFHIERPDKCPISVDFDELQKINKDICAWLYCDDSVINYPICYSGEDEFYLKHGYDRTPKHCGALFIEELNKPDFSDINTIIYGHHMKDGSMFASLSRWSDQEYYLAHPYMWLLTPDATYRVDLFAGYETTSTSLAYTLFEEYERRLDSYLRGAINQSNFTTDIDIFDGKWELTAEDDKHFIMLSTCEYSQRNARYVLHGMLVKCE